MGKSGPETKLLNKMRLAAKALYGPRLVIVKYHGNEFTEAGVSDLLCLLDGRFIAVEVKAPESYGGSIERAVEKGPTVKQLAFGQRVIEAGGVFAVCASVEQFMTVLANSTNSPT
jgi:hypothetical protein